MDEQELQRLLQAAQEEIRTLGSVSKETADKIAAASDASAKFKKQLMDTGAQFTRTMTGLAKSVGEGNTEFTVFNSVVDSVTGALTEMGKAVPFFGAAAVAAGEGAKFLLGQLQATTKAFNQVGAAGLLGAEGMTGLRNQFVEAGIDLQLYSKVIAGNSEALARFGGTAGDGAARFSKALGQVNREFGNRLMNLGNSFEDIAEQTAGYISLQTRLGRSQTMGTAELAKGSFEYAKQLDELAKLTGQSKTQLQKQQDALLSDAKFRARTTQLESQGRGKLAEDFRKLSLLVPELGPGFTDIIAGGGAITTEAAKEVAQSTRFAAVEVVRAMEAGLIGPEEAARRLQAGSKQFVDANAGLIRFTGDIPGFTQNFAKVADLSVREFGRLGAAAATAATQMERPDALTGSAVTAQKAMQEFSNAVSNFSTSLLPIAGDAVAKFSQVTADGINSINRALNEFRGGRPVAVPQFADGGIARGPATGYSATLHGAEAVVPLPDGQKIPVEMQTKNPLPDGRSIPAEMQNPFANTGLQASDGWAQMLAANQASRQSIHQELMQLFPKDITDSMAAHAAMSRRAFQSSEEIMKYALERGQEYNIPTFSGFNAYSGFQQGPLKVGDARLAENAGLMDPATGLMPDTSESTALQYVEKMLGYVGYDMGLVKIEMQKVDQDLEKMLAKITVALGGGKDASYAQVISINDFGRMMEELPKILFGVEKMAKMADGGITQGPSIAGEAGPEAVVPLPNGRSIPVDMPGLVDGIQELVSLMRAQNGISSRILQSATN